MLITGGSEERRSFLDSLLSQLNADYLQKLIQYNKILQQRNSLLKSAAETGKLDEALLQILTDQLIVPGNYLFEQRSQFLVSFLPKVKTVYRNCSERRESLHIV
ncbi:hypothetical protein KRR40_34985 [Niabella defluvii]|nr:hypothetical protein KRR40_34985 [Niabella sp. I65]